MKQVVCKFGGTSVATAAQFQKVREILLQDSRRKIVVVSAPGKKDKSDTKITDLLYSCSELAKNSITIDEVFSRVSSRFLEIESDLGLSGNMSLALNEVKKAIQKGATKDFVASRGEYLNAVLMADFLKAELILPEETIFFDSRGRIDSKTYDVLAQKIQDPHKFYVIPGFYGVDTKGKVKTFSRGGSDITGSIVARAVDAEFYENWTDVSGLLMADPSIVKDPKPMEYVTYREIRELSYMGAKVFHNEAIDPVREKGIPIHIKNTNKPQDKGTQILPEIRNKEKVVAGIAGIKEAALFHIEKNLMNKEKGFGRKVLGVFESHGVSFEHAPTGIDSMSVVVLSEELGDKTELIVDQIERSLQPDNVSVSDDLSLIATVGEGMSHHIGTAAKLFTALSNAKINVRIIDQGSSEVIIIVGVQRKDYERAIEALYQTFVD